MVEVVRQSGLAQDDEGHAISWSGLDADDSGKPSGFPYPVAGMSVSVAGTFGAGGSVKLQGSNDGTTWTDTSVTAFTAAGAKGVPEIDRHYRYYRPLATAGDGTTALDVTLFARGT